MSDFLSELASKAGLETDEAHHGVGALLMMLKGRLNSEAFSHLQNSIPNSDQILASIQEKLQSGGGGLFDTVKSMAGKVLGGSGGDPKAALQDHFAKVGLSADQLQDLLPKLHEMLAGKLPPHVLEQIKEHVPGFRADEG